MGLPGHLWLLSVAQLASNDHSTDCIEGSPLRTSLYGCLHWLALWVRQDLEAAWSWEDKDGEDCTWDGQQDWGPRLVAESNESARLAAMTHDSVTSSDTYVPSLGDVPIRSLRRLSSAILPRSANWTLRSHYTIHCDSLCSCSWPSRVILFRTFRSNHSLDRICLFSETYTCFLKRSCGRVQIVRPTDLP